MSVEQVIEKYQKLNDDERQKVDELLDKLTEQKASDAEAKPTSLFGIWKGQIKMSPDFDEPLEHFKEYM